MEFNKQAKVIKELVDEHDSQVIPEIEIGKRYYAQKNEIVDRRKMFYSKDYGLMSDPYVANHKLPSGFIKLLIKQKVNYSINDGLTLETEQEDIISDNLDKWQKNLKHSATDASKKGKDFWLFYIKDNKLKFKRIPYEQGIVIYDDYDEDRINYFIRYYKKDGKKHAELYDNENVTYYIKDGTKWRLNRDIEPHKHITLRSLVGTEVVQENGQGWGRPPVAELKNNASCENDTMPVKPYIDIYDIVNSDFANNIDDFQDVMWIVKNYADNDLGTLTKNIKKYKSVAIKGDGDARPETIDIPVTARKEFLNLTKENIYRFGQGVDMDSITSGNVTNVMIQAMFANLDLKANDFEQEVQEFWQQVMWFLNRYLEITNQQGDVESTLNFDRSLMMNLKELMEINQMSLGITSHQTTLENNPYVQNVEKEMERIEEERGDIQIDNPVSE